MMRAAPDGIDPVLSLRPHAILVDLGDAQYLIPPLYADRWLEVLLADPLRIQGVFPGLLDEADQARVDRGVAFGEIEHQAVEDAALDALTAASGRAWWTTVRICATARAAWDRIGGALWASGVQPEHISLGAWVDACWWIMCQGVDPKKMTEFKSQITVPPAGWSPEYDEAAEEANFMAMLGQAM